MRFHAFRVVYTVKELDSYAKHWQSFKNKKRITEYIYVPEISFPGSYKFQIIFFDFGSCWCKRRWNSLYGHFSRKNAPVNASTRGKTRVSFINALHPAALLHGTRSGRLSLKKCVFGCEGKITLFIFPKNSALRKLWMQFVILGQQRSFSSVFVDESFINKAQFDAGFAHRLILKDGAVPAIKDPGHDSKMQTVSETASNVCFAGDRAQVLDAL